MKIEFRCERHAWSFDGAVNVYAFQKEGDRVILFETPNVRSVPREELSGHFIDPFLCVDSDSAQFLMDQLWNCGLRPSEGTGSAGSLAATQKHLEDMRKIVFDYIAKPPQIIDFVGKP